MKRFEFQHYVDIDKDIVTSATLTKENIAQNIILKRPNTQVNAPHEIQPQESNSDDENANDNPVAPIPTCSYIREFFTNARRFYECQSYDCEFENNLIEQLESRLNHAPKTQSTINFYFK